MVCKRCKAGRPVVNRRRDDRICAEYAAGASAQALADKYHLSRQRVHCIVRAVPQRRPATDRERVVGQAKKWLTKSRKKEILHLLGPVPRCYDLTRKYRISRDLASYICGLLRTEHKNFCELERRARMESHEHKIELARRMRASGATWKFLSEYFKISPFLLFREVETDPFWLDDVTPADHGESGD